MNGCYVSHIYIEGKKMLHLSGFNGSITEEDIKSIVTKQQFKDIEYKV